MIHLRRLLPPNTPQSLSDPAGLKKSSSRTITIGNRSFPTWTGDRRDRNLVVQPLEEAFVDGFRRDLANKVCVGNVLADHFLDRTPITCLRFDQQDRLGLFDNSLFPAVRAGDRKPVCANRQLFLKEDATDLTRLIGSVDRDVVNPHTAVATDY